MRPRFSCQTRVVKRTDQVSIRNAPQFDCTSPTCRGENFLRRIERTLSERTIISDLRKLSIHVASYCGNLIILLLVGVVAVLLSLEVTVNNLVTIEG